MRNGPPRRRPGHPAGEVDGAREPAVQRVQHPERRVELRRPPVGDGHQGPHALQGEGSLSALENAASRCYKMILLMLAYCTDI